MMTADRFTGARAKLARGRKHVDDLETEVAAYLRRRPVIAVIDESAGGAQFQMNMSSLTLEMVPLDIVMIFGDAVHNIRASLDHLINELVSERGTPSTDLAFPFSRRKDTLAKGIREKMKGTTQTERELVRQLRPYPVGHEELYAIHALDLQDKHRCPINVSVEVSYGGVVKGVPNAPGLVYDGTFSAVPAELGEKLPLKTGFTRLGIADAAELRATIAEGLPKAAEEVVPTLRNLASVAENVIDQFASL